MTQTILPFQAGEDPTIPGRIAYSGELDNTYGSPFVTIENYTAVNMVVGDGFIIPPVTRKTITTDGVLTAIPWHIIRPTNFKVQSMLCRAVVNPTAPLLSEEPLFPEPSPYSVVVQTGDAAGLWVSSVIVQSLLIGDGDWVNPCILGMEVAWQGLAYPAGNYISYRYRHDDASSIPAFSVPPGSGQAHIKLPGVAAILTPSMTAQPAGAYLSLAIYVGWTSH